MLGETLREVGKFARAASDLRSLVRAHEPPTGVDPIEWRRVTAGQVRPSAEIDAKLREIRLKRAESQRRGKVDPKSDAYREGVEYALSLAATDSARRQGLSEEEFEKSMRLALVDAEEDLGFSVQGPGALDMVYDEAKAATHDTPFYSNHPEETRVINGVIAGLRYVMTQSPDLRIR